MTDIQDPPRTRTFAWADPATSAGALGRRSGLEVLHAMLAGELPPPPVMNLLGGSLAEIGEGRAVFVLEPQEYHYNPLGSIHGGIISTMLDSATGCAVHTTLPAGVGYTSLDLSVKFLRAATVATGSLTFTGTVLQSGRRTALAEARMTDGRGRLLAHATSSCLLFDMPRAAPAA